MKSDNYGQSVSLKKILLKTLIYAFIVGVLTSAIIHFGYKAGYWQINEVTPVLKETIRFSDGRTLYIIELGEHNYACSSYGEDYEYASADHAEDCSCHVYALRNKTNH